MSDRRTATRPSRRTWAMLILGVLLGSSTAAASFTGPPMKVRHVQRLLASDAAAGDNLGYHLAVDGDTIVAGAALDDGVGSNSGSVYVYVRSGSTWSQQAKLVASDAAASDLFGSFVSIEGDTLVVGAPEDDAARGSVYVFTRTGTTWTQRAKLVASDRTESDGFGQYLDLSGGTVVIGAPGDDSPLVDAGSVYVFTGSGATWSEAAKLVAGDAAASDAFGQGVALHGSTLAVDAPHDDDLGSSSGSVYVYTGAGASWSQEAKLVPADGAAEDRFGSSTALDGDTMAIAASFDDDEGTDSGSVYVYQRSGTTWTQEAKLTASDGQAGDRFGDDLSLDGHNLTVGASFDDDRGTNTGAFYLFRRAGTTWTQQTKVTSPAAAVGSRFGWNTVVNGDLVVAGASLDDSPATDAGSLDVFDVAAFTSSTHNSTNTFAAAPVFGWQQVGAGTYPINNNSTVGNSDRSQLVDVGGVPWVLWREHDGTNYETRVSRYDSDANTWTEVVGGASPINAHASRHAQGGDMVVFGGVPYVGWSETNSSGVLQVRVKRLAADGLSWEPVAGGAVVNFDSSRTAYPPTMAVSGGRLWLTWYELPSDKVRAARLSVDGTTWEHVGGILNHTDTVRAFVPRIADVAGVPYIVWVERIGTTAVQQVRASRLNATATDFEPVGGAIEVVPGADTRSPAIASVGGVPWVVFHETNGSVFQARAAKLDAAGTGWTIVGGVLNLDSTKGTESGDIIDVGGVPYVTFAESNSSGVLQVRTTRLHADGTWDRIMLGRSANADATQPAKGPSILGIASQPYLALHERYDTANNRYQIRVAQW